jgi:RimJ/RimL family protein N-acetyltransferase
MMGHAQSTLGIARLYALVKRGNQRSMKVLGRLGFRRHRSSAIAAGTEIELYLTT